MPGVLPAAVALAVIAATSGLRLGAGQDNNRDQLKVGVQPDGRIVVPTNQILQPAGKQVVFPGRPVALVSLDRGKTLAVMNMCDLTFIDVASGKVTATLPSPGRGNQRPGFSAVGMTERNGAIYVSGADRYVRIARRGSDGKYDWDQEFMLPATSPGVVDPVRKKDEPHPTGLAFVANKLMVAANRANAVHVFDVSSRKLDETIAVGVAPFAIAAVRADKVYVSNWGGDPPKTGEPQDVSSGTPVHVDARTDIADRGSVSVLEKTAEGWKAVRSIQVGLHPSGMVASSGGRFLYVANAASDTVSVIDTATDKIVETIACRPQAHLPFGSGANALALSPDGGTLYVANGTNNCIAVVRLGQVARAAATGPEHSSVAGLIPTGWYPGAVLVSSDGKNLYVANVKGHGSPESAAGQGKGP